MKFSGIAALIVIVPTLSFAKTICSGRTVEVVELEKGKPAPCEVRYTKPGAEPKVIFNAKNDATWCAPKAAEFVEKLKGMGLDCKDE